MFTICEIPDQTKNSRHKETKSFTCQQDERDHETVRGFLSRLFVFFILTPSLCLCSYLNCQRLEDKTLACVCPISCNFDIYLFDSCQTFWCERAKFYQVVATTSSSVHLSLSLSFPNPCSSVSSLLGRDYASSNVSDVVGGEVIFSFQ